MQIGHTFSPLYIIFKVIQVVYQELGLCPQQFVWTSITHRTYIYLELYWTQKIWDIKQSTNFKRNYMTMNILCKRYEQNVTNNFQEMQEVLKRDGNLNRFLPTHNGGCDAQSQVPDMVAKLITKGTRVLDNFQSTLLDFINLPQFNILAPYLVGLGRE